MKHSIGLIGMLMALTAVGAVFAGTEVDETVAASPDGQVTIHAVSGDLVVIGWDQTKVSVRGDTDHDSTEVVVTAGRNRTDIRVEAPHGRHGHRDADVDLEVHVPRNSTVTIESLSADAEVSGIAGSLRVEGVSGDVDVSSESEEVEIRTMSGDVKVEAPAGRVLVESVSGDLTLKEVRGKVTASTVSGDIEIEGRLMDANLETTSGDVRFEGELLAGAMVEVNCVSGDVDLILPSGASAEVRVTTFNGSIETEFGCKAEKVGKYAPGQILECSIGGGDGKVGIENFNGDVRIRKR